MDPTRIGEKVMVTSDIKEAIGAYNSGFISEEEFYRIESEICCSHGTCNMMGTAVTMSCIVEALGLSLPQTATFSATSPEHPQLAQRTGALIMELLRQHITATQIITSESIENACRMALAIGGSSNMVLHMCALAAERGIELIMDDFE
ncbi:unnamed protein product, partial [marine sediment metagenome]